MKKSTIEIITFLIVLVMISCSPGREKDALSIYQELDRDAVPNVLSGTEKQNGWELLFDGSTANGWRGFNMDRFPDCWMVEDGSLTMTTEGMAESQGIITEKTYGSFALSLEFKLTRAANSGILYQVKEDPRYKFPYETGPEFQVIDHESWPDPLEDWQICGACYAMYPPMKKPYKPLGEWNHVLIVVDGNHVTYMLNGEIVVKYEKYSGEWNDLMKSGKWSDYPDYGTFDEGHIALQNHGTRVWYRNIKLKQL